MARALLFDLDGTLVDSARDIARALSVVAARRGAAPIETVTVRPLVSQGAEVLVRTALADVAGDGAADLAEFRTVLAGQPVDPSIVYSGVDAAIAELSAAGHPMAIVTNKPEALARLLLDGVGLAQYFGAVVGGDTAERAKPDPAPLLHALDALGATAAEAIFIGDSDVDAAAARRCGMPFLLFEGGYGGAIEDSDVAARFPAFADLPSLIDAHQRWS